MSINQCQYQSKLHMQREVENCNKRSDVKEIFTLKVNSNRKVSQGHYAEENYYYYLSTVHLQLNS